MSSERGSRKRRLHIVLSLDNPLQQEAWSILSQAKNKTSAVCEAVCGYHKLKDLEAGKSISRNWECGDEFDFRPERNPMYKSAK